MAVGARDLLLVCEIHLHELERQREVSPELVLEQPLDTLLPAVLVRLDDLLFEGLVLVLRVGQVGVLDDGDLGWALPGGP